MDERCSALLIRSPPLKIEELMRTTQENLLDRIVTHNMQQTDCGVSDQTAFFNAEGRRRWYGAKGYLRRV